METRKALALAGRVSISAVIVFHLLRSADIQETVQSVLGSDHRVWIAALSLYLLGQVVCSYKWGVIAAAAGFRNSLAGYLSYYFIGMFFNLFLPTTVGGDIVKCYYLANDDPRGRAAPAVYTVILERFTGLAVLVWMMAVAVLMPDGKNVPYAVKAPLFAASALLMILTPLLPALGAIASRRFLWLRVVIRDIEVYWRSPRIITAALLWSLVFHLLFISVHILIGKAVGIVAPVSVYFIVYPAATLAGFVPISLNGIGPREAAYVALFQLAGVKQSDALAFGLMWLGVMICGNLTGALFYIKMSGRGVFKT